MSLFKPKKTYIKRYASKNFDKKITFAPSVKSTFSIPVSQIKPPVKSEKAVKESGKVQGPNGTIRFAHGNEYKKSFTENKPEYIKAPVVSGPAAKRPAPIEKPDLTGVKAEGKVRPVIDGKAILPQTDINAEVSEELAPSTTADVAIAKEPKPQADKILTDTQKPEADIQIGQHEGYEKEPVAVDRKVKEKTDNQTKNTKKQKSDIEKSKITFGDVVAVTFKTLVLLGVICAIGAVGYKGVSDYIAHTETLNASLSIQYAPEDYIYPEAPEDILQKNNEARKEAERIAKQNAYVPSAQEVPNLYNYDYVKTCYLTFDDGPSAEVTESILDTLKKYNIKATFFVVGKNAESYPDILKRIDAEGHSIGNHSYSHNYDYLYSSDKAFDGEMNACSNVINSILGKEYQNRIFRFPGGMFGQPASWYTYNIAYEGYQHINWNSLTGDSELENPDSEYIMNKLKESTNNGRTEDIVLLMHDAGAKKITAETLPQVIEYLMSKNYVFKPIYNSDYTPQ